MRKNSPQHQTSKAPEKASSPRLTLRFQPIRPKDERHGESSKTASVSSSDPRYQSYCVTMETRENAYESAKCEMPVSSTRTCNSSVANEATDAQLNVVSSSKEDDILERMGEASSSKTKLETQVHGQLSSQNEKLKLDHRSNDSDVRLGSMLRSTGENSNNNNHHTNPELDEDSENDQLDGRRKRRRESKDSNDSKHSTNSAHSSSRNHGRLNQEKKNVRNVEKATSGSDTESGAQSENDGQTEKDDLANVMNSSCHRLAPKVPPLKIVIPTTSILEPDKDRCRTNPSKQNLPYVVTTSSDSCDGKSECSLVSDNGDKENNKDEQRKDANHGGTEERYQRVTRSSQRMAAALASANSSTVHGHNSPDSYNSESHKSNSGDGSFEEQTNSDIHPRKRKLRSREGQPGTVASTSHQEDSALVNNYEMYLNIKKQVDKRRQSMFVVQPKPPRGFKDYLMNRSSYVLAGNAASRLCVPMIPPPQSLTNPMKDLFLTQEKERYKLRLQHIIEKEKLVLSVEQEILRVHGRAARALANQSTPLSACTILKDDEIYNHIEPEQEEKERNARTRYNGRLFLSWLQDVDDKWEKIKEAMLLRHHNEAESLHAVQKLEWEWKMKESGTCDIKLSPIIDDISVPMVHVNDDFDLLPA
uniref:Ankyrin repeat domain-containing protein 12 n=1 Tax=Strigamia maritima TaxID=126957 RepID=T1J475_STRMM